MSIQQPILTKIYLDYAATTPLDARVLAAMQPYFLHEFGNSSSVHGYGQQAEAALESARETVASALNARADEIIFTSGGSESDNLALRGVAFARRKLGYTHLVVNHGEHHAVSHTAQQLADEFGFEVSYAPLNRYGQVTPEAVAACLRPDTALVSVMYANNEIGSINPIAQIGALCHERGVLLHTDAVQAAAWLPVDVNALNVDLLSLGAHKFYGPKGVGALYVRNGTPLLPMQTGGSQERGRRAGTHNLPYIVGMAHALQFAQAERAARTAHVIPLRDHLIGSVLEAVPHAQLSGHPQERLPNHASFVFEGADGNFLLALLDTAGFACSSGSACKTGSPEPSEVLTALGLPRAWAFGSLRVTLGVASTAEEVRALAAALPNLVQKARR
ncbi:MAG: cysteine desulfurase family protein [Anaerolineales bacterium]